MKKLLLFLLCILAGCAKPVAPPLPDDASRIWQSMLAASARADRPFRLQMSMRFGEEGNTRRVTGLLWGNDTSDIRLDVQAGVGVMLAMISEAGDDFLLYSPRENKAWEHSGPNRPMLKIGVPIPFDLAALAGLLTGSFANVFGQTPKGSELVADGAEFTLAGDLAGTLMLNQSGEPVSWKQAHGPWRLALAYDEDAPFLPRSVRLESADGKRAIILVKEREEPAAPFSADQMKLKFPAGTQLLPLADYKPS